MAKATIDFNGRKYSYDFIMPESATKHNLALAIAFAKGKREGITKYTGMPKDYNLVMELLNHNGRLVFPDIGTIPDKIDYFKDASARNNEEKPIWNEETQRYERLMWRVGLTQSHTVIIDVDEHDIENLKFMKGCYEVILQTKFMAIRTNKGFWLVSQKKVSKEEFVFQHAKILNPSLKRNELKSFLKTLDDADHDKEGSFVKCSSERILAIPGVNPRGNIDILFTLLSIKRERSTIRISQKRPGDKIAVIKW